MIILDIDNCIADDEWRIPRIAWQHKNPILRYHDYHSVSPWDNCRNQPLFCDEPECIVMTARPLMYRAMTLEWLRRVGVRVKHLIMRNNTDHRPSHVVKAEQLQWLPNLYHVPLTAIRIAYDDRPEIVQLFRAAGLRAEVRSIHSTSSYENPHAHAAQEIRT